MDPEWLESLIALDFIGEVDSYDAVTYTVLRSYLDVKAEASKDDVTLGSLYDIARN